MGFASCTRSAQTELLPLQREIQDADTQDHSFPGPRGGMVHHCRLEGCLLPYSGGSGTQEFPQACPLGEILTNTRFFPLG